MATVATEDAVLPVGRVPADDARDNLMLQQLAWVSAPAGYSGLMWLAFVAVLTWIRAIVSNVFAWVVRQAMGAGRR